MEQKVEDIRARWAGMENTLSSVYTKKFWKKRLKWAPGLKKPKFAFSTPYMGRKLPVPGNMMLFVLTMILVVFVLSGGLYDLVKDASPLGEYNGQPQLIYGPPLVSGASLHDQFVIEGVVGAMFIVMGGAGFILIHYATRQIYKPDTAKIYIAIGFLMIMVATVTMSVFINVKLGKLDVS